MVDNRELRDRAIQTLRAWVRRFPSGTIEMEEVAESFEYVVRIRPRNADAANAELRLGADGTFGLYVGTALRIDELPLSVTYIEEICEALANGAYEEESLLKGGTPGKVLAKLKLPSGHLYNTEYLSFLGSVGVGTPTTRRFAPYV